MILMTHDGSQARWMLEIGVSLSRNQKSGQAREHICETLGMRVQPGPTWHVDGIEVRTHRVGQ